MIQRLKKSLWFTLAILPIAAIGAYFTALYQLDFLDQATLDQLMQQLGSPAVFTLIYIVQIVLYTLFMGFTGFLMADMLGLNLSFRLEKKSLKYALPLSVLAGLILSLDPWTFGRWIPGIVDGTLDTLNVPVILASVLYGGVVEEVMLRLFFMSLLAFVGWKLFFRKQEKPPVGVLIAANILSALLFAAAHLPATAMLFGRITPLLLVRCFLLNGGFGLFFGWLYRRHGIAYAMIGHAAAHIVSKAVWLLFL